MKSSAEVLERVCRLLLGVVVALFFAPALARQGILFFGDTTHFTPRLAFTGTWLLKGQLPLWNPHLSLGSPNVLDTQQLYPPHLLLSALLGVWTYNYDPALHALVGVLGTFALARAFGVTRPGGLLAAMAYALGGFFFGHLQHLNILVALAWIPVLLVATDRYLETSDRRRLGLAMLALGLLILGGHPQLVVYGMLASGSYCLFRLTSLARAGEGRRVVRLGFGLLALLVVGLALSAVFLLPFAEWMDFVKREERVTASYATWYSLPPRRLAGFVAPFWFGGSLGRPTGAGRLIEWSSYVGLLPLVLAPVALARRTPRVLFLVALALVALLLAVGNNTPLYQLLLVTPVLKSVRAPARFLGLAGLALALLAGFGFDALRAGAGRLWARLEAATLLLVGASVAYGAARGGRSALLLPARGDSLSLGQPDTVVLVATLLGSAALLVLLASRSGSHPVVPALVLSFVALDLHAFEAGLLFDRLAPPGAFAEPSATAEAIQREAATPRFYTQAGKEVDNLVLEQADFEGYRRLSLESLRNSLAVGPGLQSLTGFGTEPPGHQWLLSAVRERSREFDSRAAHLAGIFGVRYVIASKDRGVSAPELTLLRAGLQDLYRNEVARPRAYLVPEGRPATNNREAFAMLAGGDFDPTRQVVIEASGPSPPGGPLATALATIVREEPDRVLVETLSSRVAWLVLNDTFAPGWRAVVDGHAATVLRANALVRAVVVPAGRHTIEFVYTPLSYRIGLGISVFALLVVGWLLLSHRPPTTGGRVSGAPQGAGTR